jgi:hypothetical protein
VKSTFAILFSLLLIAPQTFAVAVPVNCGPTVAKSGCCACCVHCACCVTESERTPFSTPQSTLPVRGGQLVFLPSAQGVFASPPDCADKTFAFLEAFLALVQPPIFQRNCALLI